MNKKKAAFLIHPSSLIPHPFVYGFPTVNVQAEFFVPLVYGDEAEVSLFVSRVGRSSATFQYSVRRMSDAAVCARSTQVQVAMNLDTRRAVAIPDKYRDAFERSNGEA
jgi:acyl-CoA thioester hydrolase